MCVDSFFTEKARTHTRPLRIARHGRWLCRIMPPSVPLLHAVLYPISVGHRRSTSASNPRHSCTVTRSATSSSLNHSRSGQPRHVTDMTMQRRTWRATSHAACNTVRGMCSRRRGTACAMHGRCHGASCAGRDSARTASSSISYTPTGLPRLAAPFLRTHAPDSPRTVMRRIALQCLGPL